MSQGPGFFKCRIQQKHKQKMAVKNSLNVLSKNLNNLKSKWTVYKDNLTKAIMHVSSVAIKKIYTSYTKVIQSDSKSS